MLAIAEHLHAVRRRGVLVHFAEDRFSASIIACSPLKVLAIAEHLHAVRRRGVLVHFAEDRFSASIIAC
ncbi:hypothetical protein CKQ79_30025, partial [Klebsiella pneumoniae]